MVETQIRYPNTLSPPPKTPPNIYAEKQHTNGFCNGRNGWGRILKDNRSGLIGLDVLRAQLRITEVHYGRRKSTALILQSDIRSHTPISQWSLT